MSYGSGSTIYKTKAWRSVRRLCLERDEYRCQIRLPGCKGRASQADHVRELGEGGEWYALSNLQAACSSCNVAKRNRRVNGARANRRSW